MATSYKGMLKLGLPGKRKTTERVRDYSKEAHGEEGWCDKRGYWRKDVMMTDYLLW